MIYLAANFKYDFVIVDAYLNTAKVEAKDTNKVALPLLLSAKVAIDLNAFDVPVKLELTGKDLLDKINIDAKVTINAIENLGLTVSGGYVGNTMGRDASYLFLAKNADEKPFAGQWSAKFSATYTAPIAKVSGEISMKNWGLAKSWELIDPSTGYPVDENAGKYFVEYASNSTSPINALNSVSNRIVLGAKVSVENTRLIPGATLKLAWEGKDLTNKLKVEQKGTVAASCTIKF